MNFHVGGALVALTIISSVAVAQTLKDKEYFAEQEKHLAGEVTFTSERCGNALTAKFDWSKPPAPEDRKIYSAYGYCSAALEAMRRVCESKAGKEAVQQKIKSLTCSFGPQRTAVAEGWRDRLRGEFQFEQRRRLRVRVSAEQFVSAWSLPRERSPWRGCWLSVYAATFRHSAAQVLQDSPHALHSATSGNFSHCF